MNWKIGQKVVCVKRGLWLRTVVNIGYDDFGPKYGEICEIVGIASPCLYIKGYPICPVTGMKARFHEKQFRPLLGDSAKDELISSFKEVTETSDLPIKNPSYAPSQS